MKVEAFCTVIPLHSQLELSQRHICHIRRVAQHVDRQFSFAVGAYEAKTVNSLVGLIFDTGVNPYGSISTNTTELAKYYQTIRVDDAWGGCIEDAADRKIADVISNLKISDVVCGRYKATSSKSYYYTALYQGDSFLVVHGNTEPTCVVMTATELDAIGFYFWYTLRPEKLAKTGSDPIDPPVTDPTPTDPTYRDMATSKLTDEEKAAFSAITAEQWKADCSAGNVDKILVWAYNTIGVDITKTEGYTAKTVHNIFNYLFVLPEGTTYYALRAEDTTDATNVFYHKIQLSSIYGGTIFETNVSLAENLSTLQIGDVFCARLRTKVDGKNQDRYWIGLYQGDGKFLTVHTDLEKVVHCDVISAADLDATAFQYYFVLRPEQLAETGSDPVDPPVTNPTDPTDPTEPTEPADPNAPADGGFDLIAVLKNFFDSIAAWFEQLWNQIVGFFQQPSLKQ